MASSRSTTRQSPYVLSSMMKGTYKNIGSTAILNPRTRVYVYSNNTNKGDSYSTGSRSGKKTLLKIFN